MWNHLIQWVYCVLILLCTFSLAPSSRVTVITNAERSHCFSILRQTHRVYIRATEQWWRRQFQQSYVVWMMRSLVFGVYVNLWNWHILLTYFFLCEVMFSKNYTITRGIVRPEKIVRNVHLYTLMIEFIEYCKCFSLSKWTKITPLKKSRPSYDNQYKKIQL